jgi:hypothetical protein
MQKIRASRRSTCGFAASGAPAKALILAKKPVLAQYG